MRMPLIALAFALSSGAALFAQAQQAPPAPIAPTPRPSLSSAHKMLAAAEMKAAEMRVGVSCVIVDVRGDVVAASRMDGVPFLTIEVAKGKATTSALFGAPSGAMGDRGPILQSIGAAAGLNVLTVQGALPIVQNNARTGAIGCSGATSQQDEDAARAGLTAGL